MRSHDVAVLPLVKVASYPGREGGYEAMVKDELKNNCAAGPTTLLTATDIIVLPA